MSETRPLNAGDECRVSFPISGTLIMTAQRIIYPPGAEPPRLRQPLTAGEALGSDLTPDGSDGAVKYTDMVDAARAMLIDGLDASRLS